MRILVTNDDGINAKGIIELARMAARLGEVTVVAPAEQCSAMSQRLTILTSLDVHKVDFPVHVQAAYVVNGFPADCVRVARSALLDFKPDICFSGINAGYNSGFDNAYSGTLGAAMEAVMSGIPAIAFSTSFDSDYDTVDRYLYDVARELAETPIAGNQVFNVNFPDCPASACKGVLMDVPVAQFSYYENFYTPSVNTDGSIHYTITPKQNFTGSLEGTDIGGILDGYVTISRIKNMIMD